MNRIWEVVNGFNASAVVLTVDEKGTLYIKCVNSMGELPDEGPESCPEDVEELVVALREAKKVAVELTAADVKRIEAKKRKS